MPGRSVVVRSAKLALALVSILSVSRGLAATKTVDLDGEAANGAESKCDLNVLSSFPITIENVITNRAVGEAFEFRWASAGPGGFTSSVAPGSTGGVGARWTWSTNQTVYAFTGNSCDRDICFLQTAGGPANGTCTLGCLDDGVSMSIARGAVPGEVRLTWAGGTAAYTVFRSPTASRVGEAGSSIGTTSSLQMTDTPPAGGVFFYRVRASSCLTAKPCNSNAQCNPSTEGVCVSRGPFAVPGRSLTTTDVTVSAASLTSSLITFFSPPQELFRVTSTAQPGALVDTLTNSGTSAVTITTEAYPPGCCPSIPGVDHQLRCGEICVDYLNDPDNCGGCGIACGDGECCSNGACTSVCDEGRTLCDGEYCADLLTDSDNCGTCGNACADGTCCSGGECVSVCVDGTAWCGSSCEAVESDIRNCGACGVECESGDCCYNGACSPPCPPGQALCGEFCYDLGTDETHCGACGNACEEGSFCVNGACQSLLAPPSVPGGGPTAPFCSNTVPDPDPNPGRCPNPFPSNPSAPACPIASGPPPEVAETPICVIDPAVETVEAGETATICRPGGVLFKEVASQASVCGDSIPGPDGTCGDGVSSVTTGTYMRLVPDTDTPVGNAYITPFAVHIVSEPSKDGLIQPGETVAFKLVVINAGPIDMRTTTANILAPPVDLTEDGIDNPVSTTLFDETVWFGTIRGTAPSINCEPVTLHPAQGETAFRLNIAAAHPGDTVHPFIVRFKGFVGDEPFEMDMPLSVGIADTCVASLGTRDYDGLDGLLGPMAKLVPKGDPVPFPNNGFNAGSTLPLKLRQLCGGTELRGEDIDPPQIVGLSEAVRGEIDLSTIVFNDDDGSSDPFFRWNDSSHRWILNLRTAELGTGTFTLTIRIAGRKEYVTGFVLD